MNKPVGLIPKFQTLVAAGTEGDSVTLHFDAIDGKRYQTIIPAGIATITSQTLLGQAGPILQKSGKTIESQPQTALSIETAVSADGSTILLLNMEGGTVHSISASRDVWTKLREKIANIETFIDNSSGRQ